MEPDDDELLFGDKQSRLVPDTVHPVRKQAHGPQDSNWSLKSGLLWFCFIALFRTQLILHFFKRAFETNDS